MADPTRYTIEEVIALPKGTTPWYDQNQDAYRHIKNTMDVVADISGGGEPGFGSPIDVRHYVKDVSGSNVNYVGVTRPACTEADALVVGIQLILDVMTANQGACTLNIGTKEGAVAIKQYGENNTKEDPIPNALIGPTVMVYDGYTWTLDKSALPGGPGPEGPPGPPGVGINMQGEVATEDQLPGWPSSYGGEVGDTYLVKDSGEFYVWTEQNNWMNIGAISGAEPPFDLSQNALGDLGDVANNAATTGQVLYWDGSQWISNKVTSDIILDGGIHEMDLADNSVNDRVLDNSDDFTVNGTWTFTKAIQGDGSQLQGVASLGNQDPWTHGQYNVSYTVPQTGSGLSTRFTWDAEVAPVAIISSTEITVETNPSSPTVDGMFISITWISNGDGGQPWTLGSNFDSKLGPPEDTGVNVTRVFVSANNKWTDVA